MVPKVFHIAILAAIAVSLCISTTHARPQFTARIPNGNAGLREGSGITCEHLGHEDCSHGGPRNAFGQDFQRIGKYEWTKEFCRTDSDGDGLTNGEELGDPCCVWTPGLSDAELSKLKGFRRTKLSHPGDKSEDGAAAAKTCSQLSSTSDTDETEMGEDDDDHDDEVDHDDHEGHDHSASASESETTTEPSETSSSPSASPDESDDDNACFPATATVILESGTVKTMSDLEVGDRVMVAAGQAGEKPVYSDVFMFTHRTQDVRYTFIRFRTTCGRVLHTTPSHFVHVYKRGLVPAHSIVPGVDRLLSAGKEPLSIASADHVELQGLYNPQTLHGDIIVDGVLCSTYTTAVEPPLASMLLKPLKALYRVFSVSLTFLERSSAPSTEHGAVPQHRDLDL